MAVKTRKGSSLWQFIHFLLRFLGVNGIFAVAIGAVLWFPFNQETAGPVVMMAGGVAIALALLAEVPHLAGTIASHRGAAGFNVLIQVLLATTLVVGGNVYSYFNSKRFDLTHGHAFTLDDNLKAKLAQLRGDTDIIVYVPHASFGRTVDLRQDDYDQAAEKIIVKRVEDLVDLFSEAGPRLHVTKFDTQSKTKKDRRRKINVLSGELTDEELKANDNPTKDRPVKDSELLKTIEKTTENSVFFYSRETKHLQRLSFNDLYYIDKKASEDANDKLGNLVLIEQGLHTFTGKIFRVEEKKPHVTVAVVHGWLGQDGSDWFGLPGFRTAMTARDFEARDIVLWKRLQSEPGALDQEENRYTLLENKKDRFEAAIAMWDDEMQEYVHAKGLLDAKKIGDFNRNYRFVLFPEEGGMRPKSPKWINAMILRTKGQILRRVHDPIVEESLAKGIEDCDEGIEYNAKKISLFRKKLAVTIAEQAKMPEERLEEQARITDVQAKLRRLLAETDLLIVPRLTAMNLVEGRYVPGDIHKLADPHLGAIRDYMKAGRPVLFCLGPQNWPDGSERDSLERLLADFQIQLPNQTILFTNETEAMEMLDTKTQMGGASIEVPAVRFQWDAPAASHALSIGNTTPIRASMNLTTRGFGGKNNEAVRIRYPRPVYVETWSPTTLASAFGSFWTSWPAGATQSLTSLRRKKYDERAVFMMTDDDCWNEDRQLPLPDRSAPDFDIPKTEDPNNGTLLEKRKGPFPIGVALETDVPAHWYDQDAEIVGLALGLLATPLGNAPLAASASLYPRTPVVPKKVRLAVIGDGNLLVGERLSPMREKLFLDVSNWLLGRDNLLAHEGTTWQYPRVQLDPEVRNGWEWGARLGMPLLFIFLGLHVALVRRMR